MHGNFNMVLALKPEMFGRPSFCTSELSSYSRIFFKFCTHICIRNEWFWIISGQNAPILSYVPF